MSSYNKSGKYLILEKKKSNCKEIEKGEKFLSRKVADIRHKLLLLTF